MDEERTSGDPGAGTGGGVDLPRAWQLLVLSARSPAELDSATDRLAAHLSEHPEQDLADVACTLQTGREAQAHRRALVCRDRQEAAVALTGRDPRRLLTSDRGGGRAVAFLFSGVGDHYPGMGQGLYETERVFRREIDLCAEILRPRLGADLRDLIRSGPRPAPAAGSGPDLRRMIRRGLETESEPERTDLLQPAVFALEMALARLWDSWGVRPKAMLGYSLGEYAAACVAGVFSLEDGLRLVAERARLIAGLPAGAMLAVSWPAHRLAELAPGGLSLAAVNAPGLCVLSGAPEAVAALEQRLQRRGTACRRLPTAHAFHSREMAAIADELRRLLTTLELREPRIPYVSNVTGSWITPAEATDPGYWVRHLLGTVRFAEGMRTLRSDPGLVLLEVGPGHGLTTLAMQQGETGAGLLAFPSVRPAYDSTPDEAFLQGALARLWLVGADVDWAGFHAGRARE